MTPEGIGPCIERETLERMAAGEPPDAAVSEHLAACATCRALLAEIESENDLLGEFLGANAETLNASGSGVHEVEGYEIVHEIHRGGQGIVYEAEQVSTRRTVAIKMMLQGRFATSKQRHRFEREVEVIAGLRHPGIVTLYESGVATGGEIYFAMEFVRGATLDQWLRAVEPTIPERVALFAEICDAVRYAHGRGIIHRDLKPGNILVDDGAHPHVLDFGLARVTSNGDGDAGQMATIAGEFLGTFAYAAPEQLEGDPNRIDVRTDVFALGILLYELLCGVRPFEMGQSLADLVQNRVGRPPAAPSSHDPTIPRDLDVICLKALSVEPERRYGSAGEFEEDLRRHLDGRPILARADSTTYVLGRLVRRHKIPFAAAILVLLLAIGSAIGFAMLAARAEAKQVLAEERLAALADFIGLFNFYSGRGKEDMRVSEAIELMDDKVMAQYQDQPEVASTILTAVGLIHLSFDNIDRAHDALQHVLELREGADDVELGEAHHNLGRVWYVMDDTDTATGHYLQALEHRTAGLGDHSDTAMTLQHLGACARKSGRFERAADWFNRSQAMLTRLNIYEGDRAASLLNSRAWLENDRAEQATAEGDGQATQRRMEQALSMFVSAGTMIREELEPNDYRIGRSEGSIGKQLARLERHDEAIERFDEAIRILSTKGSASDELLTLQISKARSRFALQRGLEETVRVLEECIAAQETLAEQRGTPASWYDLEGTCRLLAAIQQERGAEESRAAAVALAELAHRRGLACEQATDGSGRGR